MIDGYTLPHELTPYDDAEPGMEEDMLAFWADLLEWGVVTVDGGVAVV